MQACAPHIGTFRKGHTHSYPIQAKDRQIFHTQTHPNDDIACCSGYVSRSARLRHGHYNISHISWLANICVLKIQYWYIHANSPSRSQPLCLAVLMDISLQPKFDAKLTCCPSNETDLVFPTWSIPTDCQR